MIEIRRGHPKYHTIGSHDTDATGAQLDELVSGEQTDLHYHHKHVYNEVPNGTLIAGTIKFNPVFTVAKEYIAGTVIFKINGVEAECEETGVKELTLGTAVYETDLLEVDYMTL